MLLLDSSAEPRCLDLVRLDAGVLQRFEIGLDHQFFCARLPTLAELRATHAQNCDLVLDAACHRHFPSAARVWLTPATIPISTLPCTLHVIDCFKPPPGVWACAGH